MTDPGPPLVPADALQAPPRGYYLGVLPTPARGQSLADAFIQAAAHAEFVPEWGGPAPFYELASRLSQRAGRIRLEQDVRGNGLFPLFHMSFLGPGLTLATPPGLEDATLSTPDWRDSYKRAALDLVRTCRPRYLSLGNEVNRWYERYGAAPDDPNGFQHYVSLYAEIYDAVKAVSPQTVVFCVFAREIVDELREADVGAALAMFPPGKMDLLVLTSYPYAVSTFNRVSDIPVDYYSRVTELLPGKAAGFSEVAWPDLDAFGGEEGQAAFLEAIAGRLTVDRGVDLEFLGWCWLHGLDDQDPVAMVKPNGTERLVYQAWKRLSGR